MNSLMSECKFMRRVWLCRRIRHVDWNVRSRLVPGSAGDPLATAGIPLATGYALLSVGVGQLFKYYRGSRCFSLQFFVLPLDWNIRLTVPNFRSRWRWDVWLKACRFRKFGPVGWHCRSTAILDLPTSREVIVLSITSDTMETLASTCSNLSIYRSQKGVNR